MGDTNVKIKLSADGAQVRRELKLIDREIQQLGGSQSTSSQHGQSSHQPNSETQSSTQLPAIQRDSREVAKQETMVGVVVAIRHPLQVEVQVGVEETSLLHKVVQELEEIILVATNWVMS